MKTLRHFLPVLVVSILFAIASCQKGGGGGTTPAEANLQVETTPVANGHVEAPAPGPSFPLIVTLKSAMPSKGVKIDVTAKPDGGTVAFFSSSITSNSASNNFIITGATSSVVSVVDITVTSVATPSNTWHGSYKFSKK
jgi:hypothetical protein